MFVVMGSGGATGGNVTPLATSWLDPLQLCLGGCPDGEFVASALRLSKSIFLRELGQNFSFSYPRALLPFALG